MSVFINPINDITEELGRVFLSTRDNLATTHLGSLSYAWLAAHLNEVSLSIFSLTFLGYHIPNNYLV